MRLALTAPIGLLLASCATIAPRATDPVGRIYSYIRSNSDGSEAETIHVFRAATDWVEVTKMRARCTDAAFVTAEFDLARNQARRLVGGRLLPGAGHRDVAVLEHDAERGQVTARIALPGGPLNLTLTAPHQPWMLYDFDLVDLSVMNQLRDGRRADLNLGVALFWNDGEPRDALRWLGSASVRFVGEERRDGRPTLRFETQGPAFGERGGPIWFDAADGHIVAADLGLPNHAEYRDYRLRLTRVSDGGPASWRALLAAHFADCPAA